MKFPSFKPVEFHLDFEKAAINGLLKIFPEVEIKGCNFHYNQALWRKVQNLGLVVEYREREDVRQHLRMCAALAHLPPNKIDDGWLVIMENSPDIEKIISFNDYFVNEWLDSERYWVCFRSRHRTTNTTEAWHSRLNRKCGKIHPNIFEAIKILFEDSVHFNIIIEQNELMLTTPKRAKKYSDLDMRIENTITKYIEESIDLAETLRRLTYIVKYE